MFRTKSSMLLGYLMRYESKELGKLVSGSGEGTGLNITGSRMESRLTANPSFVVKPL